FFYTTATRRCARTRNRHPCRARGDARTIGRARIDGKSSVGFSWWHLGYTVACLDSPGHSGNPAAFYAAFRSRSTTEPAGLAVYVSRNDPRWIAMWSGAGLARQPGGLERRAEAGWARRDRKRPEPPSRARRSRVCNCGYLAR